MKSRRVLLLTSIALNVVLAVAVIGVLVSSTQSNEQTRNLAQETAANTQTTVAANQAPTVDSGADEESKDYLRALSAKVPKSARSVQHYCSLI
jgi:hypothetical protein